MTTKSRSASPAVIEKSRKGGLNQNNPTVVGAEVEVKKVLVKVFRAMRKPVVDHLLRKAKKMGLIKAEGDEPDEVEVDISDYLDQIPKSTVPAELAAAGTDGAKQALARVGIDFLTPSEDVWNYASQRAAELVGKKWVDGELVNNPDALWAIDETTREMLRDTLSMGISAGLDIDDLRRLLEDDYAFSPERADMIARTEVITAHNQGALSGYQQAKEAGLHVMKEWIVAEDELTCDECLDNADAGPIELDDVFPSGDDAPSAHPNCRCSLVSVVVNEETGEETDEEEE